MHCRRSRWRSPTGCRVGRPCGPRESFMVEPVSAEQVVEADAAGAPALARPFDVPWADIVLLVVGFRILLTIVGGATYMLLPQAHQPQGIGAILLNPWRHFDALRFTQI